MFKLFNSFAFCSKRHDVDNLKFVHFIFLFFIDEPVILNTRNKVYRNDIAGDVLLHVIFLPLLLKNTTPKRTANIIEDIANIDLFGSYQRKMKSLFRYLRSGLCIIIYKVK